MEGHTYLLNGYPLWYAYIVLESVSTLLILEHEIDTQFRGTLLQQMKKKNPERNQYNLDNIKPINA